MYKLAGYGESFYEKYKAPINIAAGVTGAALMFSAGVASQKAAAKQKKLDALAAQTAQDLSQTYMLPSATPAPAVAIPKKKNWLLYAGLGIGAFMLYKKFAK